MHYDKNNKIIYDCGDWVTQTGDGYDFIPHTTQVTDIRDNEVWVKNNIGTGNYLSSKRHNEKFRPATQEEIDKVEDKIMVGEYVVEFEGYGDGSANGNIFIKVGCVRVSKELFLKIGKKAGWI